MRRARVGALMVVACGALLAGAALAGAATGQAPAPTPGWPACIPRRAPIRIGVRQVGRTRHGRLITLRLRSRAMGDVQPVDVLLPRGYVAGGRTRYRVLYVLHGAGGNDRSYVENGIARQLGRLPVITVMPAGTQNGVDGGYSDWYGAPAGWTGPVPAWESYHIRELIPFIDAHFPTVPTSAGRAIAGISMGGGGATKYAAEYPGTFGYAGTFSGEAHPLLPVAVAFQPQTCKWGDPATEQVIWRDNDSAELAGNLHGVRVFVRSGNGTPGPFDSPTPPADPFQAAVWHFTLLIEFGAHLESQALVAALRAHGNRPDVRFFDGSHRQPYWNRDMRQFLAWLRRQFRRPPAPPDSFSVASAHPWFTAWGWTFRVRRRVREFAYVRVSPARLTVTGSGTVFARAPSGRRLTVRLGPSHARQQTRFGPSAARGWRRASVPLAR